MSASPTTYRPDIDGLRAIAVLSVVLCHAELFVPGGYVGVDVFFVVSGFLITSLILKELEQGTFSLRDFWERRVRRIVPALLAVTAVTLLAGWFLLLPDGYRLLGESAASLMLLGSNIHFWLKTGYFDPAAGERPLLHTWSLAVEEQFYLVMPLLLLLLARRGRRALLLLAIPALASFAWSVHGIARDPGATFYLLPTRAWELLVGALLAIRPVTALAVSRWRGELAAVLGLALILAPCVLYHPWTPFPGLAALPPVLGTALLIATGSTARAPWVNRMLEWRPLVLVGLFSYSLYLWHWPVLAFARVGIAPLNGRMRVGLVAVSLVLGWLSWRLIEMPVRTRTWLPTRPRLVAAVATTCLAILVAGILLGSTGGLGQRLPANVQRYADTGVLDPRYIPELQVEDVPAKLARYGDAGGATELVVWGDSHAMAILPAVDTLCRAGGVVALAATHSSTAPVLDYFAKREYGLNERSPVFNAAVFEYIRSRSVPVVVLAASWGSYFRDDAFGPALLRTVDSLLSTGAEVFFVKDAPRFRRDVPRALVYHHWHGWGDLSRIHLTVEEYEARNAFHASFLPGLAARGVHVLDPIAALQARSRSADLRPYDSNGSFYRDRAHLSTYGAIAIREAFAPMVVAARAARDRGTGGHPPGEPGFETGVRD
jgi:peptidoglycan/LPS O-acetylase OafA/YrhL